VDVLGHNLAPYLNLLRQAAHPLPFAIHLNAICTLFGSK